jgi:amino acid transporter
VNAPNELRRSIGFWGATGVMVGIIIGSGIFRTPASIADQLSSPWLILALWGAGGVLALCGALTYAELATMFPQSGGVYVFIREGFGRCAAFVFGWTYMLIVKPSAAGGIAVIFGEHVNTLLGTHWDVRYPTLAMLVFFTLINIRGVTLSAGLAGVLSALKFGALLAIVLLAVAMGRGSLANFADQPTPQPISLWKAIVPVMAAIMWTYDGWSDVGAIAGEVKDPQRRLPMIYLVGTAAITLIYLAVNAVYLAMIPLDAMRQSATVAPLVMDILLGSAGAVAITIIVLVSTSGSTHGSIMTGARVTYQQARDGLLFAPLGRVHPRWGTPHVALSVQLVLSCVATWFLKDFDRLAGSFVFTMWIFYGLAGSAIFVLRLRRPQAERPFRCWGYPIVPAVFVLTSLSMTVLSILDDPKTTLPWIGLLLAGVPVYFVWERLRRARGAGA